MRSVVLNATARCPRCSLTPRWCTCAAQVDIQSPLAIALLTHKRELHRPSSTGNLIARLLPSARRHVWHPENPPDASQVVDPEREVWVLHPNGLPPPRDAVPDKVQAILLDGSWSESAGIARNVGGWGRLVQLPLDGASRFWLRAKQDGGRYSTAEALLFLLDCLGLTAQRDALRAQFELHVYANLRARGNTPLAEEFLRDSVLVDAMPDVLAQLQARRPHPAS
ncbi:MAG TPA: DTW domain-containing protein [Pseudomonadales bacterium]